MCFSLINGVHALFFQPIILLQLSFSFTLSTSVTHFALISCEAGSNRSNQYTGCRVCHSRSD